MSAVLPSSAILAADIDQARVTRAEWCLRIGAAACFIGHGVFGIITKEAWLPYFAVAGIGRDLAHALMPIVGAFDVFAGIMVLLSPRPAGLAYMVIWATWTALLRPLAGESAFEMIERAGNYGVPLALSVMFAPPGTLAAWWAPVTRRSRIDPVLVGRVLLWSTALLLFAHGALEAITRKPSFAILYGSIGIPSPFVPSIGAFEMCLALLVVAAPAPALLLGVAAWKLATEALFPASGAPIWELVERGGSYAAPIALALLSGTSLFTRIPLSRSRQ